MWNVLAVTGFHALSLDLKQAMLRRVFVPLGKRARGLEVRAHLPQLREQHHLEHLAQVADTTGAAGAGLEADDALHRAHMRSATTGRRPRGRPVPRRARTAPSVPRRTVDRRARPPRRSGRWHGVASDRVRSTRHDGKAATRQQADRLVIQRRRSEGRSSRASARDDRHAAAASCRSCCRAGTRSRGTASDWNPDSCPGAGRIALYSLGVIVASTFQACTSCSMMRETRASILNAGGRSRPRSRSARPEARAAPASSTVRWSGAAR